MKRLRCAVYTRKSTEEGLEQDFSSLDAQREACEAYIASQKSEGWNLIKSRFDDGGYSGGYLDRPALQDLLDGIRQNRIDIVVVYKVDRLTRSLADFAKLVELFDAHGVSFVSVTQQFNTTTSMGRLTLNVLLSFAQFEREVTAERIRDKIAASKKKGIWMGGNVPLGYDVRDRKLIINKEEAKTVKRLFDLYLKLGSVRELKAEADRQKLRTKRRVHKNGKMLGGKAFVKGGLYHLLKNPIYIGKIAHKGVHYEGEHEAIVDPETWRRTQDKLSSKSNFADHLRTVRHTEPSPLLGLLFDDAGEPMTSHHTNKNGVRYRYYISRSLNGKRTDRSQGWRLPANEIERVVRESLSSLLGQPNLIQTHLSDGSSSLHNTLTIQRFCENASNRSSIEDWRPILHRIDVATTELRIALSSSQLAKLVGINASDQKEETFEWQVPIQWKRRGVESRIILKGDELRQQSPDLTLLRLIARAHLWMDQVRSGEFSSIKEIAELNKVSPSDVSRFLPLSFLAPDLIEAALEGKQPSCLTSFRLRRHSNIPTSWNDQRKALSA